VTLQAVALQLIEWTKREQKAAEMPLEEVDKRSRVRASECN
jgi:hypothetical protein